MIVLSAPRRAARLATACCAALAALTLTAAGATAARAGAAPRDNVPVVTTSDGAVRGATAGPVFPDLHWGARVFRTRADRWSALGRPLC